MPKSPKRSCRFWDPNQKILHHLSFEAQPRNPPPVLRPNQEIPSPSILRSNWRKPSSPVLRLNHWQTVDLDFKTQPRNLATVRHAVHSVTRPLDRSTTEYSICAIIPGSLTRSPTPVTILINVRHVAPVICTPWDKQTRFSKWNKDKGSRTTEIF
jgi:hypothetical protein